VFILPDGRLGVVVGDVAGSGLEAAVIIPPGALLCCFTDGLVERRDHPIDHGIDKLAAILDEQIVAAPDPGGMSEPPAEHACVAVMRALVGNAPAQDDIAVLMLNRHPDDAPAAEMPRRSG
jgi:serine phosphatase RsbU (regulator of sigma subunit)